MTKQIQAVYDAGVCGYTVWNSSNAYRSSYVAMQNVEIPEGCK